MANDGTYLQDKLQEVLKTFTEYNRGFFYRFYDTKSTQGGFLPAQPGDFFLLVPAAGILIECKSTEVGTPLTTLAHHGKVGKRQIAKHRMWHRAGHPSLYLYYNFKTKIFEWHKGESVVAKKTEPIWRGLADNLLNSISIVATQQRYK